MKTFEALEWLKSNNNPSALATNRFGETIHAIKFVEKLYELGAIKVSVIDILDEPERIEEEGGPYASSLIVELPKDNQNRKGDRDTQYKKHSIKFLIRMGLL